MIIYQNTIPVKLEVFVTDVFNQKHIQVVQKSSVHLNGRGKDIEEAYANLLEDVEKHIESLELYAIQLREAVEFGKEEMFKEREFPKHFLETQENV